MLRTNELPFPIIDGIGFFTIFADQAKADALATGMAAQNERDGISGTHFCVVERADGKFLVVAIETEDEVCHYIPYQMLAA